MEDKGDNARSESYYAAGSEHQSVEMVDWEGAKDFPGRRCDDGNGKDGVDEQEVGGDHQL